MNAEIAINKLLRAKVEFLKINKYENKINTKRFKYAIFVEDNNLNTHLKRGG